MNMFKNHLSVAALFALLSASFLKADTQLIYQTGVSTLPNTDTTFSQLFGANLIGPTPFIYGLTRVNNVTQHNGILYKDGALTTLFDGQTGFVDGTSLLHLNPSTGSADSHYFSLVSLNNPRDGALLRYQDGQLVTVIASARLLMEAGNGSRHFGRAAVSDAGPLAMTGFDAGFPHFMLRYADGQLQTLAQESVTTVPTSDVKFASFSFLPQITPDGTRVYFHGKSVGTSADASYREGLYYWENGSLAKVVDNKDTYPGTSLTFGSLNNRQQMFIAADGTLYFLAGTAAFTPNSESDRLGILSYSTSGVLTNLVDNTTVIGGLTVGTISDFALSADGTLVFTDGLNYFSHKNGENKLLIQSSNSGQPFGRFWVIENDLYVGMTVYSGNPITFKSDIYKVSLADGSREAIYPLDGTSPLYDSGFIDIYYFDIKDGKFLMGTLTKLIYGDLADLGESPHPIESYFYSFLDAGNDIHYVYAYEWLYAPRAYWPIVYSFTANHWLYLVGDWGYPLTAYAFGIGWIYSEAEIWPQYYNFETQTWTTF